MRFLTNSAGETLVQHADTAPLAKKPVSDQTLNISQLANNTGGQYSLIPEMATVEVSSAQFPGWAVELPPKQSLSFGFDYPAQTLHLQSSDLNRMPAFLTFPDGASAEMDGGADARLEFMDDGTYAFFGAGSMRGKNADGAEVRFGNVFPPLFGGRLIAPPTNQPNARFTRASPVTQLTLVGQIETGLSVKVGTEVIPLSAEERNVVAPNGAMVSLRLNPQTRTVDWTVKRGLFRINVDSFRCWKALGTSGQSASMQWDTNGILMEIKNKNGRGAFQKTLLVNLNPSLNVAVGDSATFQYGRTGDCATFVTSATGGETTLYNAQTGRYVRLDEGNMNVISGHPDRFNLDAAAAPKTPLRLSWNSDEQVEVKGPDGGCTVGIDGEQSFAASPGAEVKVVYLGKDNLSVRAESGGVSLTPDFMPNISVEVSEGAAVTLGYDRGSDIFRVQPDARNLSPVGLRTPTGFFPQINAGARLTLVINRSSFSASGNEGAIVFSEAAGAGASTPLGPQGGNIRTLPSGRGEIPLLGGATQNLDVSRIEEPSVTTLE